jgi:hypothetical protein
MLTNGVRRTTRLQGARALARCFRRNKPIHSAELRLRQQKPLFLRGVHESILFCHYGVPPHLRDSGYRLLLHIFFGCLLQLIFPQADPKHFCS